MPTDRISTWSPPARDAPPAGISSRTISTSSTPRRTRQADACPPAADRSKGYLWAVYPGYDIYLATDDGKIEKKLAERARLRCRGDGELEDRQDRLHFHGIRRHRSVDHELRRVRGRSRSPRPKATTAARYSRATGSNWCGAPIILPTPETDKKYRELLAENLTSPMKMELFLADGDGKQRAADYRLRLRQLRAHLHAGRQARFCSPRTSTIATAASSSCT